MSAWLPAWPTRSGVRGSRASATPERGTKFIPTQGHLCSSPRVDESPRSSGVQAGRARVRQDSSGSASGWLGLWRGRTSAPGRGAAGRHSGSGRAWGTRGASRWRAGWDSEEGSGLTAHREALGPRGRIEMQVIFHIMQA